MNEPTSVLISALGMIAVAVAATLAWKRLSRMSSRVLWMGAALWSIAVVLKIACALAINQTLLGYAAGWHRPLLIIIGGCFLGLESAIFEMGITHLAVKKWRGLGRDAPTAVGIGVGAGAMEALLWGLTTGGAALFAMSSSPEGVESAKEMTALTEATPLYFLVGPVERSIALLGHTASRALVLLGVAHSRIAMVVSGWALFAIVDGIAGAFILTGKTAHMSIWWLEFAVAPFAILSIPIVCWCWKRWPVLPEAASRLPA